MQPTALTTSCSVQHRLCGLRSAGRPGRHHTPDSPATHHHRRCRSQRAAAVSPRPSTAQGEAQTNPWEAPGYQGAFVSTLPLDQQRLAVAAVAAGLGVGTVLCSALGGALAPHLPAFLQVTRSSWFPLGPIFAAAGVAHFTEEEGFKAMYPHQGAWGLWYLPGSPSFHVRWTGVAEVLGGLGLSLGALPFDWVPGWLSPASALGLFVLTVVVTPANVYMFTHQAPGPIPESANVGPIPPAGHAARGVMQCVLLATLWGIATASS